MLVTKRRRNEPWFASMGTLLYTAKIKPLRANVVVIKWSCLSHVSSRKDPRDVNLECELLHLRDYNWIKISLKVENHFPIFSLVNLSSPSGFSLIIEITDWHNFSSEKMCSTFLTSKNNKNKTRQKQIQKTNKNQLKEAVKQASWTAPFVVSI